MTKAFFALCSCAVMACDSDTKTRATPDVGDDTSAASDTTATPDASEMTDTASADTAIADTTTADTTTPETTADTSPAETTTPACDRTNLEGTAELTLYAKDEAALFLRGATGDIVIEFYDVGPGTTFHGVGEYTLGGTPADRNYQTCSVCARGGDSLRDYFGTAGTLRITAYDKATRTISATLDATMVEATFDEETYLSTPVPGGWTWCFEDQAIATSAAPQ